MQKLREEKNILAKEKNSNWDYRIKQIERLREDWFNKNDFNLLASLNGDAVHVGLEIAEKFRDFLIKNGLVEVYSGDDAEYNGARNNTMFIRGWNLKKALILTNRCQ